MHHQQNRLNECPQHWTPTILCESHQNSENICTDLVN